MEDDWVIVLYIAGFVIGGLTLLFAGESTLAMAIGSLITASLIVFASIIIISVIMNPTFNQEDDLE